MLFLVTDEGGSNPQKIPKLPFLGKIFKFQGVWPPVPPPPHLDPRMTPYRDLTGTIRLGFPTLIIDSKNNANI